MVDFKQMLEKYQQDHQHPVNKATHYIGIPMIIISLGVLFWDWKIGIFLFVLGWIFQFVGHLFEGKKPSFFSHPAFLIVGPIHFLKKLWTKKEKA